MKRSGKKAMSAKKTKMKAETSELSGESIVSCYRRLGKEEECAPTPATSDDEILAIYSTVAKAFGEAAKQRRETITVGHINTIAWQFMRVKEQLGDAFLEEHLEYEVEKYLVEGLRREYRDELSLLEV
jgi:hypothetical protein